MSSQISVYRFGSFVVHPASRTVTDGAAAVAIPSRVFDLLLYMVRNPRRLLTKEELLTAVWADAAVEEGNLSQSVFLLRKALTGNSKPLIVTVPGRGYQFAAAVEEIAPAVEAPAYAEQIPALEAPPLRDNAGCFCSGSEPPPRRSVLSAFRITCEAPLPWQASGSWYSPISRTGPARWPSIIP
jgi:DNA-binding winged helix-turn-helix (wHTH) protein